MPETEIRTLLGPPNKVISEAIAKEAINSRFRSFDDLKNLDILVVDARTKYEELSKAVRKLVLAFSSLSQKTW